MAYTQHFGLSRNSPLNMGGPNDSKEIEPKIDTNPSEASSIIEQNNNKSTWLGLGKDILNQVKDNYKKKSFGQNIFDAAKHMATGGSLGAMNYATEKLGEVDTTKLDQDKLDTAQDLTVVGSGAIGATGYGQPVSVAADVLNTVGSFKRAMDFGKKGNYKKAGKHIGKGLWNMSTILPIWGEMKGVKTANKLSKKLYSADNLSGATDYASNKIRNVDKKGGVGLPPAAKASGMLGLTGVLTSKMASMLANNSKSD